LFADGEGQRIQSGAKSTRKDYTFHLFFFDFE
jgi:hypothetical protein